MHHSWVYTNSCTHTALALPYPIRSCTAAHCILDVQIQHKGTGQGSCAGTAAGFGPSTGNKFQIPATLCLSKEINHAGCWTCQGLSAGGWRTARLCSEGHHHPRTPSHDPPRHCTAFSPPYCPTVPGVGSWELQEIPNPSATWWGRQAKEGSKACPCAGLL